MATLSHSVPSLEVTAATDAMEISSELGRYDNNFDIDLDLTDADGDLMVEDTASVVKAPSPQDQEMNQEEITYEEDITFDDAVLDYQVIDENLADATTEGLSGADIGDVSQEVDALGSSYQALEASAEQLEAAEERFSNAFPGTSNVSREPTTQHDAPHSSNELVESDVAKVHYFSFTQHTSDDIDYIDDAGEMPSTTHQALEPAVEQVVDHQGSSTAPTQPDVHSDAQHITNITQPSPNDNAEEPDHPDTNGEDMPAAAEESQQEQVPSEHEVSGEFEGEHNSYHSTIVVYEDAEIYLFPSHEQGESQPCLLQNSSLAARSIGDLLQACREVLGESISDEQELQIEVHDLDLIIGEESAHALSTSFSEILDVYLSLHSLDGYDQPQPLYLTLSTKTKFSARLGFLRNAIADGRGMSLLWYGAAGENYSDEQKDLATGEAQAAAEVTEQPVEEKEADSSAALGHSLDTTTAETAATEQSAGTTATEHGADVVDDTTTHPTDEVYLELEPGELEENQNDFVTADDDTDNKTTIYPAEASTEDNLSGGNTIKDKTDQPAATKDNATADDDDDGLIDYDDEDEPNSTGSSTIVGDGANTQDDTKAQAASESAPHAASPGQDHGASVPQSHEQDQSEPQEQLEFQFDDENQDENQEHAAGGDYSAQLGDDNFNYHVAEGGDSGYLQDQSYETGADQVNDGTGFDTDEIGWGDDAADGADSGPHAGVDVPQEDHAGQEELWDDYLDMMPPTEQDESGWTGEETSGNAFTVEPQLPATAETLVAGANKAQAPAPEEHVDFDDFDEITYEDEETGDVPGLSAESDQPNKSPPGKRSYTEHLEGDHDDDSETIPKRLRSM